MPIEVIVKNIVDEVIDKRQKETGMTKAWLASQLGISRQALNILLHTKNPTVESLLKLAHVLECQVTDLIKYEIVDKDKE